MTVAEVETSPNVSDSQGNFEFLDKAIREQKNAIQKPETSEVDVGEQAGDGEGVDGGSEVQKDAGNLEKELKKIRFQKGEKVWDIDEDAVAEFKADKSTRKLSAKEMRDKASGEIAIENRMRELAEKKKETESLVKNFNKLSKTDPLKALELVVEYASKLDPDVKFDKFINDLAKQGESLESMNDSERKAWELERKLKQKEEVIQQKEETERFMKLKDEFVDAAGMDHDTFDEIAQLLLNDDDFVKKIKNEEDLIKAVDHFNYEVVSQKAAFAALKAVQPGIAHNDPIVYELGDLLKKNPDWTPADVMEIAEGVFGEHRKGKAAKILSRKQRTTVSDEDFEDANLSDFEYLKRKIEKDRLNKLKK